MRRFILKVLLATGAAFGLHALAGLFADGHLDAYYLRFTGPRRGALILGTSRAAQGIRPQALSDRLHGTSRHAPLNFSFTVSHSPYDAAYLHAILGKLDHGVKDGLFIVTVDPWSLAERLAKDSEARALGLLGNQWIFNGTPNYEYLVRNAETGWGSFMGGPLHDLEPETTIMPDGWLRYSVRQDSAAVAKRTAKTVKLYRESRLRLYGPELTGMAELLTITDLLERHGQVVLVRMPCGQEILNMEKERWPRFDSTLRAFADARALPYWDHTGESPRYAYIDGNHLDSVSSAAYSQLLADRIADLLQNSH